MEVTIALAYSGRDELLEAFRATLRELVDAGVATPDLPGQITADAVASRAAPEPPPTLDMDPPVKLRPMGSNLPGGNCAEA